MMTILRSGNPIMASFPILLKPMRSGFDSWPGGSQGATFPQKRRCRFQPIGRRGKRSITGIPRAWALVTDVDFDAFLSIIRRIVTGKDN